MEDRIRQQLEFNVGQHSFQWNNVHTNICIGCTILGLFIGIVTHGVLTGSGLDGRLYRIEGQLQTIEEAVSPD